MNGSNSKSQILIRHTAKASIANHVSKVVLSRKSSNTFNQILIRIPISSQDFAHRWNALKRVKRIKLFHYGILYMTKFWNKNQSLKFKVA